MTITLNCPFCGGNNLLEGDWYIDDEEVEAWECENCKAGAPKRIWNQRVSPSAPQQMHMFYSDWVSAEERMPEPDQRVLLIYEQEDGKPSIPVTSTPIRSNGSHLINGQSIYRKTLWWMPIPDCLI